MKPYWSGNGIEIYHADARDVVAALPPASVDLVLTDPPYGHNNNDGDLANRWEAALGIGEVGPARPIAGDSGAEAFALAKWLFAESKRLLKPGCCCCCCGGGGGPDPQFARWSLWLDERLDFKQMVVWDKGGLGMGWHYRRNYEVVLVGTRPGAACRWFGGRSIGNVIRESGIKPGSDEHPTAKPVALFERFVSWHSEPDDLVLDPFMGGGASMVAAARLGRRGIGVDVEERWCEMAARRVEAMEGSRVPSPWRSSRQNALFGDPCST